MKTKTFSIVTTFSLLFTSTAVIFSLVGFAISGFYPGIIVLFLVALIPIGSKFYAKKISGEPKDLKRNYFTLLTIINLFVILIVIWMSFVIVHDRVLLDCC